MKIENDTPFSTSDLSFVISTVLAEARCVCGPAQEWDSLQIRFTSGDRTSVRYLQESHSAEVRIGIPASRARHLAIKLAEFLLGFRNAPSHLKDAWKLRVRRAVEHAVEDKLLVATDERALIGAQIQSLRAKHHRKQLQIRKLTKEQNLIASQIAALESRLAQGQVGIAA